MTAFFTDFAERNARTGRPSPTPLEIQRWEDDGGAVLPRLTEGGSSFGCEYASALWRRDDSNLVVRSNRYPRHFSVGCLTVWFDGPNYSRSGPTQSPGSSQAFAQALHLARPGLEACR